MSFCVFCEILNGNIPAEIVYEDSEVMAIKDISPAAPTHILVFPKLHIPDICAEIDDDLVAKLLKTAAGIAEKSGLAQNGFRLVINTGKDGGQSVPHLHIHIIGGRSMAWPPG